MTVHAAITKTCFQSAPSVGRKTDVAQNKTNDSRKQYPNTTIRRWGKQWAIDFGPQLQESCSVSASGALWTAVVGSHTLTSTHISKALFYTIYGSFRLREKQKHEEEQGATHSKPFSASEQRAAAAPSMPSEWTHYQGPIWPLTPSKQPLQKVNNRSLLPTEPWSSASESCLVCAEGSEKFSATGRPPAAGTFISHIYIESFSRRFDPTWLSEKKK